MELIVGLYQFVKLNFSKLRCQRLNCIVYARHVRELVGFKVSCKCSM